MVSAGYFVRRDCANW
ncbi:hypothetical protein D046_6718A, partial [Vibrio parahaemolyticus V-223/04]